MSRILAIAGLAAIMMLTGCRTTDEGLENQTDDQMQDQQDQQDMGMDSPEPIVEDATNDPSASALQSETLTAQQMLDQPDTPLAERVIYFEYDSAKVSEDSLAALEAHGNFVAANGNVNLRLEGHADERGSREYNIGLGDRRAQSVRRILLFQGASTDQIDTVSYGEEQPAELGHDETSWSRNRRVELVYDVR